MDSTTMQNTEHFITLIATICLLFGTAFQVQKYFSAAQSTEIGQRLIGPGARRLQLRTLICGERAKQAKILLIEISSSAKASVIERSGEDVGDIALAKYDKSKSELLLARSDLKDLRAWLLLTVGALLFLTVAVVDFF